MVKEAGLMAERERELNIIKLADFLPASCERLEVFLWLQRTFSSAESEGGRVWLIAFYTAALLELMNCADTHTVLESR